MEQVPYPHLFVLPVEKLAATTKATVEYLGHALSILVFIPSRK